MRKYGPLLAHLRASKKDTWPTTFAEIEVVIGDSLPRSARDYQAWWANERNPRSVLKRSLNAAGWETRDLNLRGEQVTYVRTGPVTAMPPKPNRKKKRRSYRFEPDLPRESPIELQVQLLWQPVGNVSLDDYGKLRFPSLPERPGVYRLMITSGANRSAYFGEGLNMRRRGQNYRTPGKTQQTSLRINRLLRRSLEKGDLVELAVICKPPPARLDGRPVALSR